MSCSIQVLLPRFILGITWTGIRFTHTHTHTHTKWEWERQSESSETIVVVSLYSVFKNSRVHLQKNLHRLAETTFILTAHNWVPYRKDSLSSVFQVISRSIYIWPPSAFNSVRWQHFLKITNSSRGEHTSSAFWVEKWLSLIGSYIEIFYVTETRLISSITNTCIPQQKIQFVFMNTCYCLFVCLNESILMFSWNLLYFNSFYILKCSDQMTLTIYLFVYLIQNNLLCSAGFAFWLEWMPLRFAFIVYTCTIKSGPYLPKGYPISSYQ